MLTVPLLKKTLNSFGVNTKTWGKGGAKKVQDLFLEIEKGESRLTIDDAGLVRSVGIIKMVVSCENRPNQVLLQWGQYLKDNAFQDRRDNPSGKIKRRETPEEAFFREAREELGIVKHHMAELAPLSPKVEKEMSRSFPGLATIYSIHPFVVKVVGKAEICQSQEFMRTDEEGMRLVFRWVDNA